MLADDGIEIEALSRAYAGWDRAAHTDVRSGPAMQIPVFLVLFLAPLYVPRDLLSGWLETAAQVNPFTPIVEAGRNLVAGHAVDAGLAYGSPARPGRTDRALGDTTSYACRRSARTTRWATMATLGSRRVQHVPLEAPVACRG